MRSFNGIIAASIALLFITNPVMSQQEKELGYGTLKPEEYDRPGDEIDADIQEMVSRMTLEEKIGHDIENDGK
ncbi:hypothetical protein INT45_011788, partial [Circinella minor]